MNIRSLLYRDDSTLYFISGILEEWYRFYYYADDTVPDDWLFTIFLMRVRDRMIVLGAQRMHDERKAAAKESL